MLAKSRGKGAPKKKKSAEGTSWFDVVITVSGVVGERLIKGRYFANMFLGLTDSKKIKGKKRPPVVSTP